jgi:hypothetical protein
MGFTELTAFNVSYASLLTVDVIREAQIILEDHEALVRDLADGQQVISQSGLLDLSACVAFGSPPSELCGNR